jgi:hypothetical protein
MSTPPATKEATIAAITPELDALAAESMAEWKVPGLAIAIVRDGETALLKAYGQRDVEAGLPVTTDTQFTICSITKTFTATGLALLVDEGRLDWTSPSAITSRNSDCMIPAPRTASPCATCSAITAACRATTGCGCRATSRPSR